MPKTQDEMWQKIPCSSEEWAGPVLDIQPESLVAVYEYHYLPSRVTY